MVTLVLVDAAGVVLGAPPPYEVPTPWRQEAAEVVAGAQARYHLDVTVVRLLETAGPAVTYLAEVAQAPSVPLVPARVDQTPQPHRARYAEPGGARASLAWAAGALGRPVTAATQVRTWNLSSIWTIETTGGRVWLKEVPDIFGHEGALLEWLTRRSPGLAPVPLAVDGGRMLLADIPGEDRYEAPAADRLGMLERVHRTQLACVAEVRDLLALGVPDRRAAPLAALIRDTVLRYGDERLLDGLDARLAALAGCGIPDTLLHGDLHPGNVRGETVLDWGDSVIAHPGFDLLRMVEGLAPDDAATLSAAWCRWWREARPGCAPEQALALLKSISALRNAAVYAYFLDHIEPAEHVYHADDVPYWLAAAAAAGLDAATSPVPAP